MSLSVGARLAPYSVTAKIGDGGMGEVYRARDTKLDRDVALKVLPQAITAPHYLHRITAGRTRAGVFVLYLSRAVADTPGNVP